MWQDLCHFRSFSFQRKVRRQVIYTQGLALIDCIEQGFSATKASRLFKPFTSQSDM
jgi:hypothetical protein